MPSGLIVEDQEAEAFGAVTVAATIYPYLRELMDTLTFRMGLPPLVLDVLRIPLAQDTGSGEI